MAAPTAVPQLLLGFLLIFSCLEQIQGWTTEDLELFDIVEEINQNFYELMGISQYAKGAEIRKAYRKLSLQLHPDKNKAEDADVKFRQLVSVYEVLRDHERRKQYDLVLENGLPDWRMPVYYYRKVRKMGLLEMSLLLLVILTVGHWLVIWSIYYERKYELEEVYKSSIRPKREKKKKSKQSAEDLQEQIDTMVKEEVDLIVPRPKWQDIIPYRLGMWLVHTCLALPGTAIALRDLVKEMLAKKEEPPEEEEEEEEIDQPKRVKRRNRVDAQGDIKYEEAEFSPVVYTDMKRDFEEDPTPVTQAKVGVEWTDEEQHLFTKAVNKFPGGTPQRWEKIAIMVGRSVEEVTARAKKIKAGYAINVDPSAQGTTGKLSKAGEAGKTLIDDGIISTRYDEDLKSNAGKNNKTNKNKASVKKETVSNGTSNKNLSEVKIGGSKMAAPTDALKVEVKDGEDTSLVWSQNQQKILEWALAQYPRGTPERWEKVAEHIPGKNKEECMTRFKYLADAVRKRKAEAAARQAATS